MRRIALLALLLAVPLAAAAQTYTYLDQSMRGAAPRRVAVLISPDIVVRELSAGGVAEKMPEWTQQARAHITAALERIGARNNLRFATLPALTGEEQRVLDEHVALYSVVAINVHNNSLSHSEVWEKRLASGLTDYTVGPGLAFVADKSGADAALIVIARDTESSGERKAMMVLGALFGVGIPMGQAFAVAGLVDLRSGRLLWQSFDLSGSADLRVDEDASKMVETLFSSYPGAKR